MCGIIGILGKNEVAPQLVEALRRLEYRGYDSAGISTLHGGKLHRRRAVGKLNELSDLLVHEPLIGKSGIGHTRWATHGVPSVRNAHPHTTGQVSVVHNGIIENFQELREKLAKDGYAAQTDTDTEVVAMWVDCAMKKGKTPLEAVRDAMQAVKGAYSLCFLLEGEGNLLIATRLGSPLAIGYGDAEMFVGSDAIALAPLSDRITYLEDGDIAVVTRSSVTIQDNAGNPVTRAIQTIRVDATRIEKDGFKHFMEKEIYEQPRVLSKTLDAYLSADNKIILPAAETENAFDFGTVERVTMVACGTAYLACLTAKYWFEKLARIPVEVDIASEFRYREPPIAKGTLAIFVSQSGETADTLAALRYCKGKAATIWSVTNVEESSIARDADLNFPIYAGVEVGVASTKAFTCQLTVLLSIALAGAEARSELSRTLAADYIGEMRKIPALINQALDRRDSLQAAANDVSRASDILFLGRGMMYPLALEGALKLKEISYIHAEAYAAGELKHGPIALVDEHVPIIIMAPSSVLFDKTISNMQEVIARKGKVVMISDAAGLSAVGQSVWHGITLPEVSEVLSPIIYAIPAQLLAYFTAIAKGTDVDQPRNLAKSVTVE